MYNIFPYSFSSFGVGAHVYKVIYYFWYGAPYSIQFNLSVECRLLIWRLDHFHINAKWLSVFTWKYMTFSFHVELHESIEHPNKRFDFGRPNHLFIIWNSLIFYFPPNKLKKLNFWQVYHFIHNLCEYKWCFVELLWWIDKTLHIFEMLVVLFGVFFIGVVFLKMCHLYSLAE